MAFAKLKRLGTWVESERIENRNPNIGEWWQWLYGKLESDPDPGKTLGAHIAYRGMCVSIPKDLADKGHQLD